VRSKGEYVDLRRVNKPLHISSECDPMIVGREIAYRLHEPKVALFGNVVRVIGLRNTSDVFAETKRIVNEGGLKTDKGDRMRSPGGTFLYLMRSREYATKEEVKEIFKDENERTKIRKRRRQEHRDGSNLRDQTSAKEAEDQRTTSMEKNGEKDGEKPGSSPNTKRRKSEPEAAMCAHPGESENPVSTARFWESIGGVQTDHVMHDGVSKEGEVADLSGLVREEAEDGEIS